MPDTKPSRGESTTRQRILSTAMELFLAQGYEGTSIQNIIDRLGIAKGTFYHHFQGKEEVLRALTVAMSQGILQAVAPILEDPTLDACQKFLGVGQVAGLMKTSRLEETTLIFRQMLNPANRMLFTYSQQALRTLVRPLYQRIIAQGMAEGRFAQGDPQTLAELLVGLPYGLMEPMARHYFGALEGDMAARTGLYRLMKGLEGATEAILGAAPGSLPMFGIEVFDQALDAYLEVHGIPKPGTKPTMEEGGSHD